MLPNRWPGALDALRPLRSEFEVEAICFLRRPDYFLESFWNQRCREGRTSQHIGAFCRSPVARAYLRYEAFLSQWSEVSSLKAFGFEIAQEKGILQTFCDAAGFPPPPQDLRQNPSPSMTCAATIAALNRETGKLYAAEPIEQELGPDTRKTALGKRLRRTILRDFSQDRKRLRERYGVIFPKDLPEEPAEMLPRPEAAELARFEKPEFLFENYPPPPPGSRLRRGLRRIRNALSKG